MEQVLKAIQLSSPYYYRIISSEIKRTEKGFITYVKLCEIFQQELAKAAQHEVQTLDDSQLFKTPAQKIITMLREVQESLLAGDPNDQATRNMIERINYAIDKIGQRTIFDIDYPLLDSLDLAMQRRPSVTKGWLSEYSQLGLECLVQSSIRRSLYEQKARSNQAPSERSWRSQGSSVREV